MDWIQLRKLVLPEHILWIKIAWDGLGLVHHDTKAKAKQQQCANFTLQRAPRQNCAQVRLLPRSSVSSHPRRATIKFHPYAVVSMFKNHSECCRTNDDDYIFIIYHAMIRYLSELTPPSGYD